MTMKGQCASACFVTAMAEAASTSPRGVGGSGTLSTRPANQAAGIIASAMTVKPMTPARQPKLAESACPMGAENMAPSEPKAETRPSTVERNAAGAEREATAMAMAEAQHASARPTSTPAPMMMPRLPCAIAVTARPATNSSTPAISTGAKPRRAAMAPAKGWRKPQARFWMAIAKVKSLTRMPRSLTAGCMNSPRLWRKPMAMLSMTAAPSRMGRVGLRAASRCMDKSPYCSVQPNRRGRGVEGGERRGCPASGAFDNEERAPSGGWRAIARTLLRLGVD